MRIATSKIYRAFEELDDYTDQQCLLLMRRVKLSFASRQTLSAWKFGAGCMTSVVSVISILLMMEILSQYNVWWTRPGSDHWRSSIWILGICVPVATAWFWARDVVLRRQLIEAIQLHIDRVRCPNCKYILIGQKAHSGAVTCSECGQSTLLITLGVEAEDLIPPDSALMPIGREMQTRGRDPVD